MRIQLTAAINAARNGSFYERAQAFHDLLLNDHWKLLKKGEAPKYSSWEAFCQHELRRSGNSGTQNARLIELFSKEDIQEFRSKLHQLLPLEDSDRKRLLAMLKENPSMRLNLVKHHAQQMRAGKFKGQEKAEQQKAELRRKAKEHEGHGLALVRDLRTLVFVIASMKARVRTLDDWNNTKLLNQEDEEIARLSWMLALTRMPSMGHLSKRFEENPVGGSTQGAKVLNHLAAANTALAKADLYKLAFYLTKAEEERRELSLQLRHFTQASKFSSTIDRLLDLLEFESAAMGHVLKRMVEEAEFETRRLAG